MGTTKKSLHKLAEACHKIAGRTGDHSKKKHDKWGSYKKKKVHHMHDYNDDEDSNDRDQDEDDYYHKKQAKHLPKKHRHHRKRHPHNFAYDDEEKEVNDDLEEDYEVDSHNSFGEESSWSPSMEELSQRRPAVSFGYSGAEDMLML